MHGFVVPEFDLESPFLRRVLNEHHVRVWTYYRDGDYWALAEKADVDARVAAILRDNDHEALVRFARDDLWLRNHYTGPGLGETDLANDALKLGVFRLLELELWKTTGALRRASLAPATEEDLVCRLTPGLWGALSPRHRLFPLTTESWPPRAGNDPHFALGDRAIYPHAYVRPYRELMGDLYRLAARGHETKVALDPNRAESLDRASGSVMLDYWFGCKLTLESLDDLNAIGETWHVRPPDRELAIDSLPLAATVFRWQRDGKIKILEVEELLPRDATDGPYVINRYLHALRDTESHHFVHVDGAVRAYVAETYLATCDNPKGEKGEVLHYRKLFRVDGLLDNDAWGRLVAHYFRRNELVIEYFGELLDERPSAETPTAVPTHSVGAMGVGG
jgi:hypothetical protein